MDLSKLETARQGNVLVKLSDRYYVWVHAWSAIQCLALFERKPTGIVWLLLATFMQLYKCSHNSNFGRSAQLHCASWLPQTPRDSMARGIREVSQSRMCSAL